MYGTNFHLKRTAQNQSAQSYFCTLFSLLQKRVKEKKSWFSVVCLTIIYRRSVVIHNKGANLGVHRATIISMSDRKFLWHSLLSLCLRCTLRHTFWWFQVRQKSHTASWRLFSIKILQESERGLHRPGIDREVYATWCDVLPVTQLIK